MTEGPQHAATEARPEPVLDAGKLGGLVGGVTAGISGVAALVVAGVTVDEVSPLFVAIGGTFTALGALVAYVAPIVTAKLARGVVTPMEDPRNAAGQRLTP